LGAIASAKFGSSNQRLFWVKGAVSWLTAGFARAQTLVAFMRHAESLSMNAILSHGC
jgi:hypothetical protein